MAKRKGGRAGARGSGKSPDGRGGKAGNKGKGGGRGAGRPGAPARGGALGPRIVEALEQSARGRSVHMRVLVRMLGLNGKASRSLARELDALVRAGRIVDAGEGRFSLPRRDGLIDGKLFRANSEGDRDEGGTVVTGSGEVWVLPRVSEARVGDRVLIKAIGDPDRGEAELVRAVGGPRDRLVGILERGHGSAEVTPYRDDAKWRVRIPEKQIAGAKSGEVVVVETLPESRGRGRRSDAWPTGRVIERLGFPGTPEADFRAVAWHKRLPIEFPRQVISEIEGLPDTLSERALAGRLDLRDRDFLTIDPETARDHDDAVCVEAGKGGGDVLWVAIADVAHYVRPGTAVDREAERRGNSVYFPDRSIPMLPERLSSDLCSLRPDTDRLVMVAKLPVDRDGLVKKPEFFEAVIRSRAKLSYQDAAAVYEQREEARRLEAPVFAQVEALGRVSKRLRRQRELAGALEFELPEPVVVLDDRGRVTDIRRFERTDAHRAIEDAMLAANRAVAQVLSGAGLTTLHRVHEAPDAEDLDALGALFLRVGLVDALPPHVDTRVLQRVLEDARGHKEERLVHMLTLRTMKQARYANESLGHFALAFEHYLHFTSPIRRYADLVVHRTLKARLKRDDAKSDGSLAHLAVRLSALERRAVSAERDMLDLKKAALMAGHLGSEFEGVITGAGEQGVYVTLDQPFVEGLLPARHLPAGCEFDPDAHRWASSSGGGPKFGLGDRLEIRVVSVDQLRGWVNFGLIEEEGARLASVVSRGRPQGRSSRPKAAPNRGKGPRRRS